MPLIEQSASMTLVLLHELFFLVKTSCLLYPQCISTERFGCRSSSSQCNLEILIKHRSPTLSNCTCEQTLMCKINEVPIKKILIKNSNFKKCKRGSSAKNAKHLLVSCCSLFYLIINSISLCYGLLVEQRKQPEEVTLGSGKLFYYYAAF